MRLAAIDIGSNSIHMIVARIDADGTIEVVDRVREMARLGDGTLTTGFLSDEAIDRGLGALRRFAAAAASHKVDDIVAVATSAVRESRNGHEFIDRVATECGIRARIIDGIEEGRFIYLGAREVWDFAGKTALIIDIGGGSVEFVLADRRRETIVKSLKLGVRRLKDRFLPSDPPTPDEILELQTHIRARCESVIRQMRRKGFDVVIATSGTASALARLALGGAARTGPATVVPLDALDTTVAQLLRQSSAERSRIPNLDERRRDTIHIGGLLLRTFVEMLGEAGYTYVDAALREGLIVDYLERNRGLLRLQDEIPDPRMRAVRLVGRRLSQSWNHSLHVAELAVRLFDALSAVHGFGPPERELLEFAALLHNVGVSINRASHHKHALYIIRNADLADLTDRERLVVACIARYHRRSPPKPRHPEWELLDHADRDRVKTLSALLRIANALDRGHHGNVHNVSATLDDRGVHLVLHATDEPVLELTSIDEHRDYFQQATGRPLFVTGDVAPPRRVDA